MIFLYGLIAIFTIAVNVHANVIDDKNNEMFRGIIRCDDDIDFGNVELFIYEAVPQYNEDNKIVQYNEILSFTIKSDEDGIFSFERPSEFFSISVNLDTLPINYGIDKRSEFFTDHEKEAYFTLYKIDDVEIEHDGDKLNIKMFNQNDERVYAKYDIEYKNNTKVDDINSLQELYIDVIINVYETEYYHVIKYDLSKYDYYGKLDLLDKHGLLDEDQKMQLLYQYYLENVTYKNGNVSSNSIVITPTPIIPNPLLYFNFKVSGRFVVCYENGMDPNVAQQVADSFIVVEDFFESLGFKKPRSPIAASVLGLVIDMPYFIFLKDDCDYYGQCIVTVVAGSWINLDYDHVSSSDEAIATIAHEYFHGVLGEYGVTDMRLHESLAAWAEIFYMIFTDTISSNARATYTSWADTFLRNTDLELNHYTYESFLFPLYLSIKYGYNIIIDIAKEADLLEFIFGKFSYEEFNKVLNKYGSSLKEAFEEFTVWNVFPNKYYYSNVYYTNNFKNLSIAVKNRKSNSETKVMNRMSSRYIKFEEEPCHSFNVYVTVETDYPSELSINMVRERRFYGDTFEKHDISTGRITIPVIIEGDGNTLSSTIVFANTSTTNDNVSYNYDIKYEHTTPSVYLGENNIKKHFHDNEEVAQFIPITSGFYQFTLDISANPIYNADTIQLVDKNPKVESNYNVVKKIPNSTYNKEASNSAGVNNFIVFLDTSNTFYYVYIKYDREIIDISLTITYIDDFLPLDSNDSFTKSISMTKGDYFVPILIGSKGAYDFAINCSNSNPVTYCIFEKDGNSIKVLSINTVISSYTKRLTFNNDNTKIYIGYFDFYASGNVTFTVNRFISTEVILIPDPNFADRSLLGSEVNLNGGLPENNIITTGFTRNIYLGNDSPSTSRLKYTWSSSNENVAKVSMYGTVVGVSPGTAVIKAIYIDNPSIVGYLTVEVVHDTSTTPQTVNLTTDCRESSPYYGTEVSSGKGVPGGRTIHVGYTRLICFDTSDSNHLSPSGSLQDYIWTSSDNSIATVSSFATITGKSVGTVVITGVYKYNPRFTATITIEVI